jgi:hypothetical protein
MRGKRIKYNKRASRRRTSFYAKIVKTPQRQQNAGYY